MRTYYLVFLLSVAMFSIQCGASLAKQLFPVIGAVGVTFLRISFAAALLLVLFRPWRGGLDSRELRVITIYGVSLGCMNTLFYLALERLPLGITVALEFIGPLAVAIFSSRKKIDIFWAGIAVMGLCLLFPIFEVEKSQLDPIGVLLALSSACCWALYILFGKKARDSISAGKLVSLGMIVAAFTLLPIYLIMNKESIVFDLRILSLSFIVGLLSSAIPYFLESFTIKALPLTTFGVLMSLEPVMAALSGAFFLQEQITLLQGCSIGAIIFASMGSALSARQDAPSAESET